MGEKPSLEEDKQDKHFVGPIGTIVPDVYVKYITSRIGGPLHIYGTNSVRCKPPLGAEATETQAKACKAHLLEELGALKLDYQEVIILACGGKAAKQVSGHSLGKGYKSQGKLVDGFPVFYTLNPGVLMPGRDPSSITAIEDHLLMLVDFLDYGKIPMEVELIPEKWKPHRGYSGYDLDNIVILSPISLDIETYGCLEGLPDQKCFNPIKSMGVDGVSREDLICTVAASWTSRHVLQNGTSQARHLWVLPRDLDHLVSFIEWAVRTGQDLLGMNIPFDILNLRAYDSRLRESLSRGYMEICGSRLVDLAISNFLESDVRPERSLKSIAPLLRVAEYDEEQSLGDGFKYSSKDDPELHLYNVLDTVATLECHNKLMERAARKRPDCGKFTQECMDWYNDVLWTVIEMDEAGVRFSREKLEALEAKQLRKMHRLWTWTWKRRIVPLDGPGSKKYPEELIARAIEKAGLVGDRRVVIAKKTKKISTQKDNVHLALGALKIGHPLRGELRIMEEFRSCAKIVTSYTRKLLTDSVRGLMGDMAYPSWFSVPSQEKDGAGKMGGTQQGRLTCQGPGLQTSPESIRECMISRWDGGHILGSDYSQVELRVPALLSGDPVMCQEYWGGEDRHEITAIMIFGEKARGNPKLRHIGKTLNFLMLFQGGPRKFQETVRKDHGMEIPLDVCKSAIYQFRSRYSRMIEWQDGLIEEAKQKGYLKVFWTGESRTFLGSRAVVDETYIPKIVNFPVQTTAANIMKAAQREISDRMREARLVSVCQENVYDAVYIDTFPGEVPSVLRVLQGVLPCPAFYERLQSSVGRKLPLGYEIKDITTGEKLVKVG